MVVKDRLLSLDVDPNLWGGKVKILVSSIGSKKILEQFIFSSCC